MPSRKKPEPSKADRPKTEKKPPGRPSKKTAALVESICERLSNGEALAQICREEGMPAARTVRDWEQHDPVVSAAIARAREDGEEVLAAECLEIADDSRNDWMSRKADEGDEKALQFNGEHVQRSRLRIDTRLKLLSKFNPKKWGDRIQHANDPENPMPATITIVGVEPVSEA